MDPIFVYYVTKFIRKFENENTDHKYIFLYVFLLLDVFILLFVPPLFFGPLFTHKLLELTSPKIVLTTVVLFVVYMQYLFFVKNGRYIRLEKHYDKWSTSKRKAIAIIYFSILFVFIFYTMYYFNKNIAGK